MRAVRLHESGLVVEDVAEPVPGPGEAVVRVHAAALTRDELTWPTDRLPAIPSYELSGVVVDVAPDVDGVATGDEVFALTPFDRDGVAAELAAVPAALLAPKPRTLGHVESAAIPLPALSAWQALFEHGRLRPGERVRVLGAGGGVGHLAVQLARVRDASVVEQGGADLIFDTAGGERLLAATGNGARVVTVAEEAPGATYFVVAPNREQLLELARLADAGELRPRIDSVFALEDAPAAFERLAMRGKQGKVVLRIAGD